MKIQREFDRVIATLAEAPNKDAEAQELREVIRLLWARIPLAERGVALGDLRQSAARGDAWLNAKL